MRIDSPQAAIGTMEIARKRVVFALCAALAGCAVGPDYKRPDIALPTTFKEAPGEKSGAAWQPAQPNDASARGAWWSVFNDTELDALERRVEISNQDLRAAVARFDQALAVAQQARAAYFPTLTANASDTRSHSGTGVSAGISTGTGSASTGVSRTASLSFAADWEADVWGRVRRSVESGAASAQASRADLEATRLASQAQLAQDYFLLRIADAQLRLFDETVAGYTRSLELTRNRYNAGVVTRADVAQAETQLASTRAQQIDAGINRAQLEHSIAVLCGEVPANFALAARNELPNAPSLPQIPASLPAQLLERRPDIAGAERRAAAANAEIGVAQAAYFPTLSLAASGGWRGSSWSDLISLPNRFWSVGPQLAATLFDGGARRAATAAARAGFDQTAAQYRQTVLSALQEVEDNLVALRVLAEEALVQLDAVRAARESLDLTTNQYKAGTVSYLNVITAQAALYSAQRTDLDIRGRQLTASVTLIRALGGGWAGLGSP